MLLIAEIILTIVAWNKGWKWLSLIPIGISFLIGVMLGLSGFTSLGPFAIFDILAIIALVVMVSNPKTQPKKD